MANKKIEVVFRWKNWNSSYSSTRKSFNSQKDLDDFWEKAISDNSERKPLGFTIL